MSLLALLATTALATSPADRAGELDGPDFPGPGTELPAPTIINGGPATADEWPMAGGLLANATVTAFGQTFEVTMFMCSSTLIAPDVVLTAAHCVDEEFFELQTGGIATIEELRFFWSGQSDLSMYGIGGPNEPPAGAGIGSAWAGHPDFVGAAAVQIGIAANHDIALIFLDEPVLDVPHAYLTLPEEADQLQEGADVVIVGWGNQEPVPQGQQPKPGKVAIKQQGDSVIGAIGPTEFQVGPAFEDVRKCQGDSGGPTFMAMDTESTEAWRVIGVTSHVWDLQLCERTGGVDTRVDHYLDWIDAEMRSRCEDGSRSWCEVEGIVPPPFAEDDVPLEEEPGGCSCSSAAGTSAWWAPLGLLALAALRRRR